MRVLVVEDSSTARALLVDLLQSDPDIEVVGEASNGAQAVALVGKLKPSILLMDIEMPVMDGFEATKRIMVEEPTPIIIVTARHNPRDVEISLRAVRLGALTVLPKPSGPGSPSFGEEAARMVGLVKALADVRVVRRRWLPEAGERRPTLQTMPSSVRPKTGRVVAVAASTGGPAALYRFLELMPADIDAPLLVVQHIAAGFLEGLVSWLGSGTAMPVKVAEAGEGLEPGTVYVAPDDRHLQVHPDRTVQLSLDPPIGSFRPSASALFASVASVYGSTAAGVILTGMGSDGLEGTRALRQAGALVLAQDEKSSVVFGMPRAVAEARLVDVVGSVEELASALDRFVPRRRM